MKVNYVCISRNCVAYCLITGFADIATGIHDQRSEYELPIAAVFILCIYLYEKHYIEAYIISLL